MRSGLRGIIAITLIGGAAACTTPHHSNALIFGTNTNFGITVAQDATATPNIVVGYRRQEAVFMPLVATARYDTDGTPTPCTITPAGTQFPAGTEAVIPPCLLVGRNGDALDAYSVLASFGAQFSASSTNPQAGGGLAQFFATGLAAQALAIRGGSSLVAVSSAAGRAAAADNSEGLAALYGSPAVRTRAAELRGVTRNARVSARGYLDTVMDEADFAARFERFAARLGEPGYCTNLARAACLAKVDADTIIIDSRPEDLDAAVAAARGS